ncbi:DUF6125 family protein [Chloroflexota bacterium]
MKDPEADESKRSARFSLENCSVENLIALLKTYAKMYVAMDAFWYLSIMDEFGNDKALEHDLRAWDRMYKRELDWLKGALGIRQRDVPSLLRILSATPWFIHRKYDIDLRGNNYGVLTIAECPTLLALEEEGAGRERGICEVFHVAYFSKCARYFNPDMETKALKLPPRVSPNDICCRWEFKIPKAQTGQ